MSETYFSTPQQRNSDFPALGEDVHERSQGSWIQIEALEGSLTEEEVLFFREAATMVGRAIERGGGFQRECAYCGGEWTPLVRGAAAVLATALQNQEAIVSVKEVPRLTPRPWEILLLLDKGYKPKEIRVMLGFSEHTLRSHLRTLREAFGVCSYEDAVRRARDLGMVR